MNRPNICTISGIGFGAAVAAVLLSSNPSVVFLACLAGGANFGTLMYNACKSE